MAEVKEEGTDADEKSVEDSEDKKKEGEEGALSVRGLFNNCAIILEGQQ